MFRVLLILLCFPKSAATRNCKTACECINEDGVVEITCRGARIKQVPTDLPHNVTELYLSGTHITDVQKNAFTRYPNIKTLYFRDFMEHSCMLESLEPGAFNGMNKLQVLGIVGCERLIQIPKGVLGTFNVLHTLQILRSGLTSVPDFSHFRTRRKNKMGFMDEIELSSNRIVDIPNNTFTGVRTHTLKLDSNRLRIIRDNAFINAHIVVLNMVDNKDLKILEENAFRGIKDLDILNLSRTSIQSLPVKGLAGIKELYIKETKTLMNFPSILQFSNIKIVQLYYPHHCCAFKNPQKQYPAKWKEYEAFQRKVQDKCSLTTTVTTIDTTPLDSPHVYSTLSPILTTSPRIRKRRFFDSDFDLAHFDYFTGDFVDIGNESETKFQQFEEMNIPMKSVHHEWGEMNIPMKSVSDEEQWGDVHIFPTKFETPKSDLDGVIFHEKSTVSTNSTERLRAYCGEVFIDYTKVSCTPEPDAFNPCEDVMGYKWLRIFVWLVVMAALFGNLVVLLVLITSRSKMTVAKFLMCNLAFADFLMGIYLLLLASIDAHTLGEYFNYAIFWQNEGGCQAAGFITVFSSELSIFTLTVITLERWYAISHAIHLTKRLKLRQAVVIMACGWTYAAIMAHLPLVGVSNYGNVSVCLPMKAETVADLAFIISLLVINGCAFLVICACYMNMYFRVRGSESTANSSDATIAKRMAMLVFTNFICWAPIAFFGLTASAGIPLIDITNSKILLVFFYPLNSCANPYLYVIITKQFRKDMYVLLGKYGICTERANRYKLCSITNSKTVTHSTRKDSFALNNVIHPVDGSLTHFTGSFRSSKDSRNGTPSITPQRTPYLDAHSPNPSVRFRSDSDLTTNCENKASDRKLSIVPEISQMAIKENSRVDQSESSVCNAKTKYSNDYVVFFPPKEKKALKEKKDNPVYEREMSHCTQLSNTSCTTERSSISDGSHGDPWVLQGMVTEEGDENNVSRNVIAEENHSSIDYDDHINEEKVDTDDENDDDDDDDDKVQQTLLKHCTMRDSPAAEKSSRNMKCDINLNAYYSKSPSECSLDEFDENSSLFNEIRLS